MLAKTNFLTKLQARNTEEASIVHGIETTLSAPRRELNARRRMKAVNTDRAI